MSLLLIHWNCIWPLTSCLWSRLSWRHQTSHQSHGHQNYTYISLQGPILFVGPMGNCYISWRLHSLEAIVTSKHLNSTSAHHKPAVSPIQPPGISRTNCNAIVDFDAIQGPSWMPESNYSLDVTDDPSCPQWHVRASPTIPNQPHDFPLSLSDQYPWEWRVPQEPVNISHSPQQEFQ